MASELNIDHFKALLISRREELQAVTEAGEEAADTVELDQTRVGRLSRMDALQSQAMSQETNRRRDIELKRIASALNRIEEGDYGYCITCGEMISEKRLEIDPAAPLCIDCASRSEQ